MERPVAPGGSPSSTSRPWKTPRLPRTPCATLKSTGGKSGSTIPSQRGHTLPRLASTWESQPIAMRAGVVVTAEVAVADTVTTADTVEGTGVDTTPEGLLLLTIEVVVVAAVAEGTTGRDRDPTHHVARIPTLTTERGKWTSHTTTQTPIV